VQDVALDNQEHGEQERLARRAERMQDRTDVSRSIANITRAIADAGHSDALLKSLKEKEADLAEIRKDLERLDVPIQSVPRLTEGQIRAGSDKLIERLKKSSPEERRQLLRGILAEVRAERVEKRIFALVKYYYPFTGDAPPFDDAPKDGTMLPISLTPLGALLHRQLFSYPAVLEERPRSR
jgi:ParB-like chromosome segregation protein Spo0J